MGSQRPGHKWATEENLLSLSFCLTPSEDRMRRQLSANQKEDPHQEPNPAGTPTSDFQAPGCEKTNVCCLSPHRRWHPDHSLWIRGASSFSLVRSQYSSGTWVTAWPDPHPAPVPHSLQEGWHVREIQVELPGSFGSWREARGHSLSVSFFSPLPGTWWGVERSLLPATRGKCEHERQQTTNAGEDT